MMYVTRCSVKNVRVNFYYIFKNFDLNFGQEKNCQHNSGEMYKYENGK